MRDRSVAESIASTLAAMENRRRSGNDEWLEHPEERIELFFERYINGLTADFLPHGSGIDGTVALIHEKSTPERLVFSSDFHHMNDGGYYDGWTEHEIVVQASLYLGLRIRVTGRDRNDIKEYLRQTWEHALSETVPASWWVDKA